MVSSILNRYSSFTFSLLFVLAFLGLMTGTMEFSFAALRFNSARISIAAFTGCAILWLVLNVLPAAARRLGLPKDVQKRVNPVTLQPAVFIFGLVLILLSDFAARRFGYFSDAASPALVMYLGSFAVILLLLHRRLNEQTRWTDVIATWPVLLFCQAAVAASFFHYANGRILFSDDHPSFIYRLHLLAEHFPFIPHYNTDWNAGYGTTELFSTGPLNLFLAAAPILYFMHGFASYGAAAFYTEIIGVLFIGIIPLCVVSAARLFGLHNKVALTAALLILAPTTGLFEWLLKYGTVPFALAAGLAPLTVALIYRLALAPQRPRAAHAVGLFIAGTLCMFWSLSAIVFLPAAIIAFSSPKVTFAADRRRLVAAFLALFILCNGLWFWRLASELDVFSFVKSSSMVGMTQHKSKEEANALSTANTAATALVKKKPGKSLVQIAQTTKKKFLQSGSKFNPLVLLFFIPGIAVAPRGTARKVLATTTFWLLFVAIIGDQYKPQLELKRMAVNASYFMSIFAACAIIEVISRLEKLCSEPAVPWNLRRIVPALGAAVVLGFLFFTPFTAAAAYGNRSWEKFTFSPPIVKDLSAAIREHGGSGRTFIFDFVLHELGSTSWNAQDGGHIAPLASLSGKPLYASDYYHRVWRYTDPLPHAYLTRIKEGGVEEFLDLINATAVVTFTYHWENYCRSQPHYREVFSEERWRLFVRERPGASYFLRGSGEVRYESEGFSVKPAETEVVVKFRYFPKVKTSSPQEVEIYPVPAFTQQLDDLKTGKEVSFIGLRVKPEFIARGKKIYVGYFPARTERLAKQND